MKQVELFNDHFQNFKKYLNCKAQLIIADPPYNLGKNAYASNPQWYIDGDNKNGESEFANKEFFDTDKNFKPAEFMHFCSQMLVKEPKNGLTEEELESGEYGQIKDENIGGKRKSQAPCMILFCAFEQMHYYIELGQRYGFKHYIPLVFYKNFSPQVLKANMKIVGATEFAVVLYRDKLPKFNNGRQIDLETGKPIRGTGKMVFDWFKWEKDGKEYPKLHPTQKPINVLKNELRPLCQRSRL